MSDMLVGGSPKFNCWWIPGDNSGIYGYFSTGSLFLKGFCWPRVCQEYPAITISARLGLRLPLGAPHGLGRQFGDPNRPPWFTDPEPYAPLHATATGTGTQHIYIPNRVVLDPW